MIFCIIIYNYNYSFIINCFVSSEQQRYGKCIKHMYTDTHTIHTHSTLYIHTNTDTQTHVHKDIEMYRHTPKWGVLCFQNKFMSGESRPITWLFSVIRKEIGWS